MASKRIVTKRDYQQACLLFSERSDNVRTSLSGKRSHSVTSKNLPEKGASSSDYLGTIPSPRSAMAHWSSFSALAGTKDISEEAISRVVKSYAKTFGVPEGALPHLITLLKIDLQPTQGPHKCHYPPRGLCEVFVNGEVIFPDDTGVAKLREKALRREFEIYADDVHGEIILCGRAEQPKKRKIRKGETMTWKVLLALLERPGGFWSYSELFERVEGIPWKDSGSCRKAYQWVRHVKDIIDKALDAWGADEKLWVEDIFNTRLGAGRVYVSPEITACIVRYQTPH